MICGNFLNDMSLSLPISARLESCRNENGIQLANIANEH